MLQEALDWETLVGLPIRHESLRAATFEVLNCKGPSESVLLHQWKVNSLKMVFSLVIK